MVNVCYLVPIASFLNAMSYGLLIAKDSNYRNQLSLENGNEFGRFQYTFIRPNLSKREENFKNDDKNGSDFVNGINDENYDGNNVSCCSLIGDITDIPSIKESDTPVKDRDNEYYVTVGRASANRADLQKLKKVIDHYLGMGKEKWAGFLAISSSGHFQHIIKKLKKVSGKSGDHVDEDKEDCHDHESHTKPDSENEKTTKKVENIKYIENIDQYSYELKYPKNGKRYDTSKQLLSSNIIKDDLVELRSMFLDVSKYWESEDAKDIMESANHVTYEDFKVEGEEEFFGSDLPSEKEFQVHEEEILEELDADEIKTDEQKMWLKSNALRRANLIQKLFDGELGDEDIYECDHVHFKDGNAFASEDESEFENMSPGFKMQSTNLAFYIAFMATEIAFIIGF